MKKNMHNYEFKTDTTLTQGFVTVGFTSLL